METKASKLPKCLLQIIKERTKGYPFDRFEICKIIFLVKKGTLAKLIAFVTKQMSPKKCIHHIVI